MSASWLFTDYAASRAAIENDLRATFWRGGFKGMWFSCTKDKSPFECQAEWNGAPFVMEWEPQACLLLKMKTPNKDLLTAFEKFLGHKALAAYKNSDGNVVVEWRVKDAGARYQELQASGVAALERLDK